MNIFMDSLTLMEHCIFEGETSKIISPVPSIKKSKKKAFVFFKFCWDWTKMGGGPEEF